MNSPDDHRHGSEADRRFEQRARELWHEAAQRIDPATAGRLRAARRQALDSARTPASPARWLIPAGACAMVALAALMVRQPPRPQPVAAPHAVQAVDADVDNDLPPDAEQADPNLYQNLDFYGWLATNNSNMAAH